MSNYKDSPEYLKGRNRTLIALAFMFLILSVWSIWGTAYENKNLKKCSKFTVGQIIRTKHRNFKTRLVYSFAIDNKTIERDDFPNPTDISDWLNTDFDTWKGRRLWIQVYCQKSEIHRVLWNYEVPDTLTVIPKNGWDKLPYYAIKK
jgi:hypothetical protein